MFATAVSYAPNESIVGLGLATCAAHEAASRCPERSSAATSAGGHSERRADCSGAAVAMRSAAARRRMAASSPGLTSWGHLPLAQQPRASAGPGEGPSFAVRRQVEDAAAQKEVAVREIQGAPRQRKQPMQRKWGRKSSSSSSSRHMRWICAFHIILRAFRAGSEQFAVGAPQEDPLLVVIPGPALLSIVAATCTAHRWRCEFVVVREALVVDSSSVPPRFGGPMSSIGAFERRASS